MSGAHHPEQRKGEIFMGNATLDDFEKSLWTTKRAGNTAYDLDGNVIVHHEPVTPWFVSASEIETAIRTGTAFGLKLNPEWLDSLREMLKTGRLILPGQEPNS